MPTTLAHIINQFDLPDTDIERVERFGSGHIHDTYRVYSKADLQPSYVLQRINHHVFQDVDKLMENMHRVTEHIRQKTLEERQEEGKSSFAHYVTLQPTYSGRLYHQDATGNYWRLMNYIHHAQSFDVVQSTEQARAGGWSFGKFHVMLQDLDPSLMHEVIPNFHHVGSRLSLLKHAVHMDSCQRVVHVQRELEAMLSKEDRMQEILRMGEAGLIPKRVIHNDTKFNNVLLGEDFKPVCVIDLDTVMPGYLAYDFGDAIRTVINTGEEDEADLGRVRLNLDLFEAYAQGYLQAVKGLINETERNSLLEGVLLMPYMQSVRFLTDYLEGDHYFKTRHPEYNFQRTRTQWHLYQLLEEEQETLRNILLNA